MVGKKPRLIRMEPKDGKGQHCVFRLLNSRSHSITPKNFNHQKQHWEVLCNELESGWWQKNSPCLTRSFPMSIEGCV
jgi:hypothetical protein